MGNWFGSIFGSMLPGLVGSLFQAYSAKKSYDAQKDAAEIQSEAAAEQVRAAGFQEQMAGQQEMAAMESQRLAELNALDAQVQNAREEENLRTSQAAEQSESRARAAASGVTLSGSTGKVLDEQGRVADEQLGWLKQVGESKVRNIVSEGETAKAIGMSQATKASAKTTKAGAYNALARGASNIFNIGATNKWWG